MLYGRTMYNRLSRFIQNELPSRLIQKAPSLYNEQKENAFQRQRKTRPTVSAEFSRRADSASHTVLPRASTQSAPKAPSDFGVKKLSVGKRVIHSVFGVGEILSVREMGGDILYEVKFDSGVTKKLMATFAKLKTVD
jgi:DNA helicase-2/ATP-dependent DNA helicase PcrA